MVEKYNAMLGSLWCSIQGAMVSYNSQHREGFYLTVYSIVGCDWLSRGERNVLQQRLKGYFKKVKASLSAGAVAAADAITTCVDQRVDYFCVMDFEATCWEDQDFKSVQSEIIEFPAVLLNAKSLVKEAEFHSYCQPIINPVLSEFCTSLTGITQVNGDGTISLPCTSVLVARKSCTCKW